MGDRVTTITARGTSSRFGLAALGLGAFVVGTAELVVVGVLDVVADDLDVSISTAGLLVTAYALGISFGGPLLTAATIGSDRRALLWGSLGVYVAGNALALAAPSFWVLLLSRVLAGSMHGLFIGVAFAVAAALVPDDRRGQAMAVVMGGITVAIIIGVPLGTAVGDAIDWRAAFGVVVLLGLIALAALSFVPRVSTPGAGNFAQQARAARAPGVLAMLGLGLVIMCGQFAAFTYLAPYLQRVTGISAGAISAFLLIYGVAAAAGTFLGGKAADRGASATLICANALLVLVLGLLYLLGATPLLAALLIAAWGTVGFGLVPALQLRVIELAGEGSDLAATLSASAVNLGIAVGSVVGGAVVTGSGVRSVVLAAMLISALAIPGTWASRRLKAPSLAPRQVALNTDVAARGASRAS